MDDDAHDGMTDGEEIEMLVEEMRSGDENQLIHAAPMLGQFGAAAVPGLLMTLHSTIDLVRDYSAMALGIIGAPAETALPALCLATHDANDSVRYAAIMAIGRIGKRTAEVETCLRAALTDLSQLNQKAALAMLRKLNLA